MLRRSWGRTSGSESNNWSSSGSTSAQRSPPKLMGTSPAGQLRVQPATRLGPVTLDRPRRHPKSFRRLFLGQPAEIAALDDLTQPRVESGQTLQRLVERQQGLPPLSRRRILVERDPV